MNPASVIMYQPYPTAKLIISSYWLGFPFDLVHAVSTEFFMWFISEPMIDKLERVKIKYGLVKSKWKMSEKLFLNLIFLHNSAIMYFNEIFGGTKYE